MTEHFPATFSAVHHYVSYPSLCGLPFWQPHCNFPSNRQCPQHDNTNQWQIQDFKMGVAWEMFLGLLAIIEHMAT